MTAAATVAVAVVVASLAVALVLGAVDLAAIFAAVDRQLVRGLSPKDVVAATAVIVSVGAVVDERSEGPWTEATLDKSVALKRAIACELAAALARAVGVLGAGHALAAVRRAVSVARLAALLASHHLWRHDGDLSFADGLDGRQPS